MSKRPLSAIIKDWSTQATRETRKTPFQIRQITKETPNSLEAKLYANPYASILASPLRKCSFHNRVFPSKLLLRFGLAWHSGTNRNWAFPTLRKAKGFGYYVNLKKDVLQALQKGGYQATFRGAATYRSDMVDHVQNVIFQQTYDEFYKHPLHVYDILEPITQKQWKTTCFSKVYEYQCILTFDANAINAPICELDHQIRPQQQQQLQEQQQQYIPCYNMCQFWSEESINTLKSQLNILNESPLALGVPRSINTVQLAIDLWHCRQFIIT